MNYETAMKRLSASIQEVLEGFFGEGVVGQGDAASILAEEVLDRFAEDNDIEINGDGSITIGRSA